MFGSLQAHLYSLGMTLLFAAEYSQLSRRSLSKTLTTLINDMTLEDYDLRVPLEEVLDACEGLSKGRKSATVCRDMVMAARLDLSASSEGQ